MNSLKICLALALLVGCSAAFERRENAIDSIVPGYREKRQTAGVTATGGAAGATGTAAAAAPAAADSTEQAPGGFALWDGVATTLATPFAFIAKLIGLVLKTIVSAIGGLFGGGGGKDASAGVDQITKGLGKTAGDLATAAQDPAGSVGGVVSGAVAPGTAPATSGTKTG